MFKEGVFLLFLLPIFSQAFDPGCSFSSSQCIYNVKLGHEGVCDTPGSSPGGSGGSQACCEDVQSNVNNLQGLVEQLTNQMNHVQQELGIKQTSSALLNSTANERDKLLQELQQKEAEFNKTNSNLADLLKRSDDIIRGLREELANKTRDLNNCKGVLGMKTNTNTPVTVSGDFNMSLCTFEKHDACGYTQDLGDHGNWAFASGQLSQYTGPREDHTYGSPMGRYMYLDPNQGSYSGATNRSMRMMSPTYEPAHDYCLRFWYNMYGTDIRSLRVYAKIGAAGLGYPIFTSSGSQGLTWHLAEVSLDSEYTGHPFQIVFEGWTDSYKYYSYSSYSKNKDDMAVDDIYLYNTACSKIPRCPPGSITRKDGNSSSSCYTFHTSPLSWYASAEACSEEGAFSHLVSVNSLSEQMFLVNTIKQNAGLAAAGSYGWYTSGNDERKEGTFDWTDTGTPYVSAYTDWHAGQPNNVANDQDCLLLQYSDSSYEWGDIDCDEAHPYICEVEIPIV